MFSKHSTSNIASQMPLCHLATGTLAPDPGPPSLSNALLACWLTSGFNLSGVSFVFALPQSARCAVVSTLCSVLCVPVPAVGCAGACLIAVVNLRVPLDVNLKKARVPSCPRWHLTV